MLKSLAKIGVAGTVWYSAIRAAQRRHPVALEHFRDQVVVITGGSRGLGLVLAREFAAEGAKLALLARDEAELHRAADDLARYGVEVLTVRCDLQTPETIVGAIDGIVRHFGRLDVLVNNAGTIQVGPVAHMTVRDFEDAMGVHFWAPLYTMLAAVPHMQRQGGGRIVNISSVGGQIALPHMVPYSASKFALVGLSDGMRAELAADNIAVTTVSPGLMRTGSHVNALFKGRHQQEFTIFSLLGAMPFLSTTAENASRQIIEACRRRQAALTITPQARLLSALNFFLPELTADLMALANHLLPAPTEQPEGDLQHTGWESQTPLAPSPLTSTLDEAVLMNNETRGHIPPP